MNLLNEIETIAKLGSYQTDLTTGTWVGSDNFIKIFGLPKKEFYTLDEFQAIVHPEDFEDVMTYFGTCLAERKNFNYTYRCLKDNGATIYVNSRSHVYYSDEGVPLKIVGIKQDITEQRLKEVKLSKLNTTLKILNTKKTRVLGTVAHDLRNPISAMENLVYLLKNELNEEQLELIQLQELALEETKNLINELLETAALEKNTDTKIKKEDIDLNYLVLKSIQRFQAKAYKNAVQIKTNLIDNAIVPLNKNKFSRVIDNLLSNALKFTPKDKTIEVKTAIEDNYIILTIKDEGIGIPEKNIPFLFKQLPDTLKRTGINGEKSVGLGLSIVKEIVDLHDGIIDIKSQKNKGTTFSIRLKSA